MRRAFFISIGFLVLYALAPAALNVEGTRLGSAARADVPTVDTLLGGLKEPDYGNLIRHVGEAIEAVQVITTELLTNNWPQRDMTSDPRPALGGDGALIAEAKTALENGDDQAYQAIIDKITAWRKKITDDLIPRTEKVLKKYGGAGSISNTVNETVGPYEAQRRILEARLKKVRTAVDTARQKHNRGSDVYTSDPDTMPADLGDAVREYKVFKAAINKLEYWVLRTARQSIDYKENFDRGTEALRVLKKWKSDLDKALSDLAAHKAKIDKNKVAGGKGLTPAGGGLTNLEKDRIKRIGELRPDVALNLANKLPGMTTGAERGRYAAKINKKLNADLAIAVKVGSKKQADAIRSVRSRIFDLQILYEAGIIYSWWEVQLIKTKGRADAEQPKKTPATEPKTATPKQAPSGSATKTKPVKTSQAPGDGLNPNGTGLTNLERSRIGKIAKLRPDIAARLRRKLAKRTSAQARLRYTDKVYRDLLSEEKIAEKFGARAKDGTLVQSERINKVALLINALKSSYKPDARSHYSQTWWDVQKLHAQARARDKAVKIDVGEMVRKATDAAPSMNKGGTPPSSKTPATGGDKKKTAAKKPPPPIPGFDATESQILRDLGKKNVYDAAKLINKLSKGRTATNRAAIVNRYVKKQVRKLARLYGWSGAKPGPSSKKLDPVDRLIQSDLDDSIRAAGKAAKSLKKHYGTIIAAEKKAAAARKAAKKKKPRTTIGKGKKKPRAATKKTTKKTRTSTKKKNRARAAKKKRRTAPRRRAPVVQQEAMSCFTGETLVLMADGKQLAISKIRIGDRVRGRNGVINLVTGIERPKLGARLLYGFNGATGFVTAEHPFMTAAGWKSIDPTATFAENPQLRVGVLRSGDQVMAMTRAPERELAYSGAARPAAYWPGPAENNAMSPVQIDTIKPMAGDPAMTVYNLLLDGDHSYFANGLLVHNKG